MIETWLAAVLRGDCPEWQFDDPAACERILLVAQNHGIVALLHDRLQGPRLAEMVPVTLRQATASAAQLKAMQSLLREYQCRLILAQLERLAIPALLLKGSALAYWAYPSTHLRECSDIDLLLRSRSDVDRVVAMLETLHFTPRDQTLPGDLVCFEMTCVGTAANNAGLEIDLHWQLSSTPTFAFRLGWDELQASAKPLPSLAANARGLAPVHALMHACMHRIQNKSNHLRDKLKWLYDLEVLAKSFAPADWNHLATLAIERGLAGTCADGIRAAQRFFGTSVPPAILQQLSAAAQHETMDVGRMDRWWYVQRMNLLAFPSVGQRLRWLRQRAVPNADHLSERYGPGVGWCRSMALRAKAALRRMLG